MSGKWPRHVLQLNLPELVSGPLKEDLTDRPLEATYSQEQVFSPDNIVADFFTAYAYPAGLLSLSVHAGLRGDPTLHHPR